MMIRIVLAFAICVAAWAATPALAQSGSTDAVPTVSLAPSPAPYDSTAASSQEARRVQDAPQDAVPADAKQTTPPKEIPVAEGKVPETLAVENAPQNSATADAKPAENSESRFTFSRMSDGYVRLDNRTGQVAFCSKRTVGWTCQLAPEDRGVLENEIARLQEENVSLKKEFLARGLPLPGSIKSDPPVGQNERPSTLPSDPNIERMKVMVENAWRRLVDMISALQKEVLKKS
jgi:hypothetical protein